ETFAWRDMPEEEQLQSFKTALNWGPTHLCEMGADLSSAVQSMKSSKDPEAKIPNDIKASLEATGSGISRLQLVTPPYPIFNWDDVPVKEGLHNRHMVGLMAWNAFLSRTSLTLHGKRVAVIGYGLVGTGVAETARAFGGAVSVVEKDPSRILQAKYAGWEVVSLEEALPKVDVVVTATGATSVLNEKHFPLLKDGAFLINVGHHSKEIDVSALFRHPHQEVLPFVTSVKQEKSTVYLFANGAMANLVAGKGDSLNSFDVILGVMVAGISHIVGAGSLASPGIHLLPREVWEKAL
ncbi:MAG: adenosylhomocysteinase, partial [Bdellovibrionia bacterium]